MDWPSAQLAWDQDNLHFGYHAADPAPLDPLPGISPNIDLELPVDEGAPWGCNCFFCSSMSLVPPTPGSRLPARSPQTQIRQPSLQTSISRHWEAVSPVDKSQCLKRGERPERPRCMTLPVDSHTIQYAIVPVN